MAKSKRTSLHPNIGFGPLRPSKYSQVSLNVPQLPYQPRLERAHVTRFTTILISNWGLSYSNECLRISIVKNYKEPWNGRPSFGPVANQYRWITNDSDCIISYSHSWIFVPLTYEKI